MRDLSSTSTIQSNHNEQQSVTAATEGAPSTVMAFLPLSTSKKFPFKCHEMLQYAERHGLEDIVSWLPGGKGFRVHNHDDFCKKVLKATFNHSNYKSFEKQLNNWGFQREAACTGKAYSNPNFVRGRKSLCQAMTSKSTRTITMNKQHESSVGQNPVTSTITGNATGLSSPIQNAPTMTTSAINTLAGPKLELLARLIASSQAKAVPARTSHIAEQSTNPLLDARAVLAAAVVAAASSSATNTIGGLSAPTALGGSDDTSAVSSPTSLLLRAIRDHQTATALSHQAAQQQHMKDTSAATSLVVAAWAAASGAASTKSSSSPSSSSNVTTTTATTTNAAVSAAEIELVVRRLRLQQQQLAMLDRLEAQQDEYTTAVHALLETRKRKAAFMVRLFAEQEEQHERATALLSLKNSTPTTATATTPATSPTAAVPP